MQIVFKKIEELTPYANNARTHSSAQVDEIVRSMREFGWTNPVLLDENGTIIAGHGRVLAATRIYARGETILDAERNAVPEGCAPCIVLSGLTDAQRRAYILADNKLALNAGWDEELLRKELNELLDLDFNIEVVGFDDFFDEISSMRKQALEEINDIKEEDLRPFAKIFFLIAVEPNNFDIIKGHLDAIRSKGVHVESSSK